MSLARSPTEVLAALTQIEAGSWAAETSVVVIAAISNILLWSCMVGMGQLSDIVLKESVHMLAQQNQRCLCLRTCLAAVLPF